MEQRNRVDVMHEQISPLLSEAARLAAEHGINLVAAANVETNSMLATAIFRDAEAAPIELMIVIPVLMDVTQGADKAHRKEFIHRMAGTVVSMYRDDLLYAKMILREGVDSEAAREVVARYQKQLDAEEGDNPSVYADEAEQALMIDRLHQDLTKAVMSSKEDTSEPA